MWTSCFFFNVFLRQRTRDGGVTGTKQQPMNTSLCIYWIPWITTRDDLPTVKNRQRRALYEYKMITLAPCRRQGDFMWNGQIKPKTSTLLSICSCAQIGTRTTLTSIWNQLKHAEQLPWKSKGSQWRNASKNTFLDQSSPMSCYNCWGRRMGLQTLSPRIDFGQQRSGSTREWLKITCVGNAKMRILYVDS